MDTSIKPITVDIIKNSLRIDGDLDNDMIQRYITFSENYVKDAVNSDLTIDILRKESVYNQAVCLFTEYLYQQRGIVSDKPTNKPFEIVSCIQQLQGKYSN